MMTAKQAAKQITSVYDDFSQFESVALYGTGEWEDDRAVELAEQHDLDWRDIEREIVSICQRRAAADDSGIDWDVDRGLHSGIGTHL